MGRKNAKKQQNKHAREKSALHELRSLLMWKRSCENQLRVRLVPKASYTAFGSQKVLSGKLLACDSELDRLVLQRDDGSCFLEHLDHFDDVEILGLRTDDSLFGL